MDPVDPDSDLDPQHWLGSTKKKHFMLILEFFLLQLGGTGFVQERAVPEEGIHNQRRGSLACHLQVDSKKLIF